MLMTVNGLNKLKNELKALHEEEKSAVEAVVTARSFGDFSENAELETANSWLERTRMKIAETETAISEAEIFDITTIDKSKVGFGAEVELEDQETGKVTTYKIVGQVEANVQEGKISLNSPLAKALHGKREGDDVALNVPAGEKDFTINKLSYSWLND